MGVMVISGITNPGAELIPEIKKQIKDNGWFNPVVTSCCLTAVPSYPSPIYTYVAHVEFEKDEHEIADH